MISRFSFYLDHVSSCYWVWPRLVDITMSNTWETWLQNNEEIWSHPKCNLSQTLSDNMDFQFNNHLVFPLYYESCLCSWKWTRMLCKCWNLYKSVFRQTGLEKHLEYDNPRLQTQKSAQIEYWRVRTAARGTDECSNLFLCRNTITLNILKTHAGNFKPTSNVSNHLILPDLTLQKSRNLTTLRE